MNKQAIAARLTKTPGVDFGWYLYKYILRRLKQILFFGLAFAEVNLSVLNSLKQELVNRMFWGRGSLYRTSFHLIITFFTSILLLTGLLGRLQSVQQQA